MYVCIGMRVRECALVFTYRISILDMYIPLFAVEIMVTIMYPYENVASGKSLVQ